MSEPESIERDGVSYVPRLWLQGHRDALDTALARVEVLEAHVADADTAFTRLMQARDRWIAKVLAAEARTEALEAVARAVLPAAKHGIDEAYFETQTVTYQAAYDALVALLDRDA